MMDRGLLEMAASDPQKGILVPGNYIGSNGVTGPVANPQGPGLYNQKYVFTPLNSWKYWPNAIHMRFSHKLRRTFYNPTNVVQTVYVTECRRRRSQIGSQNQTGAATDAHCDIELLDMQPFFEDVRNWWTSTFNNSGFLAYTPVDCSTTPEQFEQLVEAGEAYKRFLYIRFGRYEQLQYGSRGMINAASYPTGPHIGSQLDYNVGMNRWDPRASYNFNGAPSDPELPDVRGYSGVQNIRDPLTSLTTAGAILSGGFDPWYPNSGGSGVVEGPAYRFGVDFNPLQNPLLRRLFRMRRVRYVIPPGGSATHTYYTFGSAHPFKSRLMAQLKFYAESGTVRANRNFPYCLPFPDTNKPSQYAHTTPKVAGWSDVTSIVQVKGQMSYLAQPNTQLSTIQYAPTRVVSHDRHEVRFRVCSYGRPAVGGVRKHTTFLASNVTGYISTYPTAVPSQLSVSLPTGGVAF